MAFTRTTAALDWAERLADLATGRTGCAVPIAVQPVAL